MKVVFLESAELDIKELKAYVVKKFGKDVWATGYQEIKTIVTSVANGTITGKVPFELLDLNVQKYRQVLTTMNKIIYEVIDDTVYIHIVCDQRRDFATLLMQRLFRA
jgi:toxin ParE1/3/4